MLIQIHNSTISAVKLNQYFISLVLQGADFIILQITTGKDGGEVSSGWDFILMGLVTLVMSLFGFPVIGSLQTHVQSSNSFDSPLSDCVSWFLSVVIERFVLSDHFMVQENWTSCRRKG